MIGSTRPEKYESRAILKEQVIPSIFFEPQWYALFVCSNQEKQTASRLDATGVEHLYPCYESLRQWKDRRVKRQFPLFPGYLFVRLPFADRAKVLHLPNVVCLAACRNAPTPVSETEINWIKHGVRYGQVRPHTYLQVGQRVRVRGGMMSGIEGILLRHQNRARVVISMDSITQAFAVEIEAEQVEAIA